MNRISALFVCVFIVTRVFCAHPTDSICVFSGDIKGLGNNMLVFNYQEDTTYEGYHNDTVRAVGGHFVYSVHLKHPVKCNIRTIKDGPPSKDPQVGSSVYYTKHGHHYTVFSSVELENRPMYIRTSLDSFRIARIENAPMQDTVLYFQHLESVLYKSDTAWQQWVKANPGYWGKTLTADKARERDSLFLSLSNRKAMPILAYIKEHPSSYLSADLLWMIYGADRSVREAAYNALDPALRLLPWPKSFKANMDRKEARHLNKGQIAPDISLTDTAGHPVSLSTYRGQVVLVDFWASWCAPCRVEGPRMVKLYKQYHKKGLVIFSVSMDADKEQWRKAIEHDGLSWIQVSGERPTLEALSASYGIEGIPSVFLLDREGRLFEAGHRSDDLKAALKTLLK